MSLIEAQDFANACLLCRVGSTTCAFDLNVVGETMRPLPIEKLAGMPEFVLGISLIRGSPTPVIDASRLLQGISSTNIGRFVTLKVRERRVALAVDAVTGVHILNGESLESLPPLLQEAGAQGVERIASLDSDLMLVLRSARVLSESLWAEIESAQSRTGAAA